MPDPIGRACIFPLEGYDKYVTAVDVAIIRLGDAHVLNKYILYAINNLYTRGKIEVLQSGTTRKRISRANLAKISFPVPPLEEQHRFVAKIEELFSSLDKGIESLKAAQQQLKIYRQSVLKWAFEGRITQTAVDDNSIPFGWKLQKLEEITRKIQIGPFGTQLHKEDYVKNGIPIVNPMHLQDGQIIPNPSYTITQEKRDTLPEYILEEDDIILGRRGEMGRCALVQAKESGWLCGTGSLYIRPNNEFLNSKYLYYLTGSESIKKYLEVNAAGTTMANLNAKIINQLPIKVPPLDEQKTIVTEIEDRLTVCDKLEDDIFQNLQHAEALRQSILKKAFEGKLAY